MIVCGYETAYIFMTTRALFNLRNGESKNCPFVTHCHMNINDIAKVANVSTATVSRVINDSAPVRQKTRDRVMEVIEKYGYTPSAVAQSLSAQNTHNIGVILPDIENPFFSGALMGVSVVAEKEGYNVFFFNSDEDIRKEHGFLEVVRSQRMDGIIISPADCYDGQTLMELEAFRNSGVKVVLLDRQMSGGDFSLVRARDREGAYAAVKQLIKEGHSRVAIIRGHPSNKPVHERYMGYAKALEEAGIPMNKDYVRPADQKQEIAYKVTGELMSLVEPPTAIFTCNNMMTLGCLRALTEEGITPGKDIALIGYDDIEVLRIIGYPLTVVDRSSREMGRAAARLLIDSIEDPLVGEQTIEIPAELILRGSEKVEKQI